MYLKKIILVYLLALFVKDSIHSQMSLGAQLRTRTEIRDGLGNLNLKTGKIAAFTSQRTRLLFGYKWDRVNFGFSIQDIRLWGQDASTITNADGNRLMLHEGWADLILLNKADTTIKTRGIDLLTLKIGRQELNYDDVRLIGNLDWLQQGRRHDMALLKAIHHGWQIDLGYAFNQNTDAFGYTSTGYVPANVPAYIKTSMGMSVPTPNGLLPLAQGGSISNKSDKKGTPVWTNPPNTNGGNQDYKSFTSLYISKKYKQTKLSGLLFHDQFGKYKIDSVGNVEAGYVFGRRFLSAGPTDDFDYSGSEKRYTYGLMINHATNMIRGVGKVSFQVAYYAQSGKNRDGISMKSANHYSASVTYQQAAFSITPGYDVLSGNDINTAEDEKFDPLYGTPHRHWGYMDFFYVGTGSPAGGLRNAYLKLKYTSRILSIGADLHTFSLDKKMLLSDATVIGKKLGTELDLVLNYNLNKLTNVELGYSMMKATKNMPLAKGQATTQVAAQSYDLTPAWFYTMIRFTPDFLSSKSFIK